MKLIWREKFSSGVNPACHRKVKPGIKENVSCVGEPAVSHFFIKKNYFYMLHQIIGEYMSVWGWASGGQEGVDLTPSRVAQLSLGVLRIFFFNSKKSTLEWHIYKQRRITQIRDTVSCLFEKLFTKGGGGNKTSLVFFMLFQQGSHWIPSGLYSLLKPDFCFSLPFPPLAELSAHLPKRRKGKGVLLHESVLETEDVVLVGCKRDYNEFQKWYPARKRKKKARQKKDAGGRKGMQNILQGVFIIFLVAFKKYLTKVT